MLLTRSKDGVPIRLTHERFQHIAKSHTDMAGQEDKILETVNAPDYIQEGDQGTKIAVRFYEQTPLTKKFLVVVYREFPEDGFVLTAYFTTTTARWRKILWKR